MVIKAIFVCRIAAVDITHSHHQPQKHVFNVGLQNSSQSQVAVSQHNQETLIVQRFGLITLKLALNLFEGATGCHEWEAGFLLAEFVLSNPDLFAGEASLQLVNAASCQAQSCCLMQLKPAMPLNRDNCRLC